VDVSGRLAIGELKDHRRIYAIIIIVIALTMTSFMLENAYLNYMMQVVDDTTKLVTSDVIIVDPSTRLRDVYGTEAELNNAGEIAQQVEDKLPGYQAAIRVTAQGTYGTSGEALDACTIQGIDPEKDGDISGIADKIVEGKFFDDNDAILRGHTPLYIEIEGPGDLPDFVYGTGERLLEGDAPYPIIVGSTVGKNHPTVGLGRVLSLTLSVAGKEQSYATVNVKVIGFYESGTPTLDALVWFMHADSLREIKRYGEVSGKDYTLPGVGTFRGYSPIVVDRSRGDVVIVKAPEPLHKLNPVGHASDVKKEVLGVFSNLNVDAYSWHDFLVYIAGSMQDVVTIMLWGSIGVTLFLCGAAIKYVMDSIIMRKTREIGSLKAFGARDRVIFKIFLYQGLVIGLISGILGMLVSVLVMNLVNWYGLNVEFIAGTQLKIGFVVNWLTLLIAIALPIVLSVVAAAIPAKKASMLSPVEALRKGELSL